MAKAPSKPKVGDPFVLEGHQYVISELAGKRAVATPATEKLPKGAPSHPRGDHHAMNADDLVWHDEAGVWTLAGRFDVPPQRPSSLTAGPAPEKAS